MLHVNILERVRFTDLTTLTIGSIAGDRGGLGRGGGVLTYIIFHGTAKPFFPLSSSLLKDGKQGGLG